MIGIWPFNKQQIRVAAARPPKRRWSYVWCALGGMALMLAGQLIIHPHRAGVMTKKFHEPDAQTEIPVWGVLKEKTLMLERPARAFSEFSTGRIEWHFADSAPTQVHRLLDSCGLAPALLSALQDESRWETSATNVIVHPPLAVVRDMAPLPRQLLYEALARTPENLAQRFPYVFRGEFEEWLAGCALPAGRLEEVRQTIYKKGDVSVFADLPYFQLTAPSNEVLELARVVSRVPTVLLGVEMNEYSDLQDLRRYWLAGNGGADFNPLLASLSRVPGGTTVSVTSLLPPFARLLLYSYPRERADFPSRANCVWSSMNFFNEKPDNHFIEEHYTDQVLQTQYHPLPKASALGDIIMLYRPGPDGSMDMIHMCAFIADDVVFTKNGGDVYQPWVLMRLSDVQALFANEPVIKTAVFRRNHHS